VRRRAAAADPASVTPIQMAVVLRQVMPRELQSRGIADAAFARLGGQR
jgi:hypothetical protein